MITGNKETPARDKTTRVSALFTQKNIKNMKKHIQKCHIGRTYCTFKERKVLSHRPPEGMLELDVLKQMKKQMYQLVE